MINDLRPTCSRCATDDCVVVVVVAVGVVAGPGRGRDQHNATPDTRVPSVVAGKQVMVVLVVVVEVGAGFVDARDMCLLLFLLFLGLPVEAARGPPPLRPTRAPSRGRGRRRRGPRWLVADAGGGRNGPPPSAVVENADESLPAPADAMEVAEAGGKRMTSPLTAPRLRSSARPAKRERRAEGSFGGDEARGLGAGDASKEDVLPDEAQRGRGRRRESAPWRKWRISHGEESLSVDPTLSEKFLLYRFAAAPPPLPFLRVSMLSRPFTGDRR